MAPKPDPKPKNNGGRPKGAKNKRTILREQARAAAAAKAASPASPAPRKGNILRGVEIMRQAANRFLALAAQYQPSAENMAKGKADEKKFAAYLKMAADIAGDLAPYEDSKLSTTVLRGDPEQPVAHKLEIEFV